jgi:DNA-binding MarR family transcriptional regulator
MAGRQSAKGFVLAKSVGHMLHRAQQFATERFARDVGVDLTLRQFALIAAVAEQNGRTQTDLVQATGIDRSTLADMIGRMEDRGFLQRDKAAEDKRAKTVSLTAAGKSALAKAVPAADAADAALLAVLDRTQRTALLTHLSALTAALAALAASDAVAPAPPAKLTSTPRGKTKPAAGKAAKAKPKPAKPAKKKAKA